MGGDGNQLVSSDNPSESFCMREAKSVAVWAESWRSDDGSISQEFTDKLLAFGSMNNEGLVERLQLQYKSLKENCDLNLEDTRARIRGYNPGGGIQKNGGICHSGFAVPKVTTLLIVGFSGAGKSCLINNMIRVLENTNDGFDRAQSYVDPGNGSLFLQEYLMFSNANFCVFDSRGFSRTNAFEDLEIIKQWMSNGVCHGEAVSRPSDTKIVREALEGRGRQGHSDYSVLRRVDFVIFVVNAFAIFKMRENRDVVALESLTLLYRSPFLSFKDDVPVIVMTHGDQLNPQDRILTRIFIGELLGVSPIDQIFDVSCFTERIVHPGDIDLVSDLVLLNMLSFTLERAEKNFPYKPAKTVPTKILGLTRDIWKLPAGSKFLLLAVLSAWLISAVLVVLVNWKFSRGSRSWNAMNEILKHAHRRR